MYTTALSKQTSVSEKLPKYSYLHMVKMVKKFTQFNFTININFIQLGYSVVF